MTETLRGDVETWQIYGSKGWGWGHVRSVEGAMVKASGVIPGIRAGDHVDATGATVDGKYGLEFRVTSAKLTQPSTDDGAETWLAERLPNIGAERARKLIAHFGGAAALWAVIDTAPHRLAEVHGITTVRAEEIRQTWLSVREDREHEVALCDLGLTPAQIARCRVRWMTCAAALTAIRTDPYALMREVPGFGWARADGVARRSRLPLDSPCRITAACAHVLTEHAAQGHVWMPSGHYQRAVMTLLGLDQATVYDGIIAAVTRGLLVRRGKRIYLSSLDREESEVHRLLVGRLSLGEKL